ncbi:hypothetical protein QS62_07835, partial [Gallibacterium salpingitidis]
MNLKLLDLFKRITWAKNGDLTDFSQTNYEAGWAHLGDDTPTVQDFNFVQQMNDKKDQWLFNQLKAVLDQAQIEPTEENINTLRDAILKLAKGYSTPNEINAESVNFIDETGHTHEISKANTTQAGIVQLTSDLDSDSETLGLNASAGKNLKALINAITSNLSNYIQNSKKSNAIDSSSSDTVATSYAVNKLNDLKVSKSGDIMTGDLILQNVLLRENQNKSLNNVIDAVSALFTGDRTRFQSLVNAWGTSGTTPLGVSYDFSNPNGWWIKFGPLYGNLIIQ